MPKIIPALLRQEIEATQRGTGFVTELLVAEPLQSGYMREFLVARKGPTKPTKKGFGGAGARYIPTNFDLLDIDACSREQDQASSQPERPSVAEADQRHGFQ
jgi:hypothetical protein